MNVLRDITGPKMPPSAWAYLKLYAHPEEK